MEMHPPKARPASTAGGLFLLVGFDSGERTAVSEYVIRPEGLD
jgi:hypothetical protein